MIRYFAILVLALLLNACAQFERKLGIPEHQLTCSPSYETLCAGWKTKGD